MTVQYRNLYISIKGHQCMRSESNRDQWRVASWLPVRLDIAESLTVAFCNEYDFPFRLRTNCVKCLDISMKLLKVIKINDPRICNLQEIIHNTFEFMAGNLTKCTLFRGVLCTLSKYCYLITVIVRICLLLLKFHHAHEVHFFHFRPVSAKIL